MENITTLLCPKCKNGILTCEWKNESYSIITEYGEEWDSNDWIEIITQTCACQFEFEEEEEIGEAAKEKLISEYGVTHKIEEISGDIDEFPFM